VKWGREAKEAEVSVKGGAREAEVSVEGGGGECCERGRGEFEGGGDRKGIFYYPLQFCCQILKKLAEC